MLARELCKRVGALSSLALCLFLLIFVASCEPADVPDVALELIEFEGLESWQEANHAGSLRAFARSCTKLVNLAPERPMGRDGIAGLAADWQEACRRRSEYIWPREFFEQNFRAYRVVALGEDEGLFTGYYEPLLFGDRQPSARFAIPLREKPADLVRVDLGRFDPELEGQRLIGHVSGGKLEPYPDRKGIEAGELDEEARSWLWVDDKIAKFFLQIQGSGQVRLPDGGTIRVGYGGQNGHPYRAIGRDLIEIGALEREKVSLQSIRRWLEANPDRADAIMHRNASYIFFRELTDLADAVGPLGSQNVPLEPGHAIAVDRRFWPMGMPVWLDLMVPGAKNPAIAERFSQLLIAQDTGGAIRGAIRGDVFWGSGDHAEQVAGHMRSQGGMIVLLPIGAAPTS